MKHLIRRTGAACLLVGSMLLAAAPAQAATRATFYYPHITAPKNFTCVQWQWMGNYRQGSVWSENLQGKANQSVRVGDPDQKNGIMAMPGEQMNFLVTDGNAFPGQPCTGSRVIGYATVTVPAPDDSMDITLGSR
ncbi:hypothetical protein [Streptomyces muensis]|uniref:Secreted protein n=1 Tax=Streptomyces muensis TaxID=1077944 RepID=A0A9X1PZN9_STRM4|nr:hypothetical protein [Streptomyces muensis]MCF1595199.1 hypothetical protein [Streptomyces muensis]